MLTLQQLLQKSQLHAVLQTKCVLVRLNLSYIIIFVIRSSMTRTFLEDYNIGFNTDKIRPGFHPNAIACVACVAFGWKPGLRQDRQNFRLVNGTRQVTQQ